VRLCGVSPRFLDFPHLFRNESHQSSTSSLRGRAAVGCLQSIGPRAEHALRFAHWARTLLRRHGGWTFPLPVKFGTVLSGIQPGGIALCYFRLLKAPPVARNFGRIKDELIARAGETITSAIRSGMNSQEAAADAKKAREQYRGLPVDELAEILIRRAARKTKWEGAANGLAVSGCEAVVASPVPEPSHKAAAGGAAVALLLGDMAYATRVQMQLLLSIAELYGCPFERSNATMRKTCGPSLKPRWG
jgi:hypothetical protein